MEASVIGRGLRVRINPTPLSSTSFTWLGVCQAGRAQPLSLFTCIFFALVVFFGGLFFVRPCLGSQLLVVGASAADVALSGATVAEPKTPAGAMFANPAGLSLFGETTVDLSAGISFARTEVDASNPPRFDDDTSFIVLSPGFGFAVPLNKKWHFGLAAYGAVGTRFDFQFLTRSGSERRFFSESGVLTFASGFAYRVSDRLSVGGAITPLYGQLKMKFYPPPSSFPPGLGQLQGVPFRYTLRGPGIQGMFGLRWEPRAGLALGLGARTPGRVWMDGPADRPTPWHVDLELEMPAQIFAGVTKQLGDQTTVSLASRWTDSSRFGNSLIKFPALPGLGFPFVPAAEDEYRVSLGVEYAWSELLDIRLGGTYSNAIVPAEGVSPLVLDTDDYRVSAGFGLNFDHWSLDFMGGHAFEGNQSVAAHEAIALPGRYSIGGEILMLAATWHR